MTDIWLKNTTPDSITGMIFAFEGIKNAVTLLNGPTGCKFYHSAVSEGNVTERYESETGIIPEEWYFEQPRVPCTYLDKRDYVYGSEDKLREALGFISETGSPELITVVNSPGASLIGDDIERIAEQVSASYPIITAESSGYSKDMSEGYRIAAKKLIDGLCIGRAGCGASKKNSVNLLGISIYHKYYEGSIKELTRLFKLCGIEINCVLCAGSTIKEIESIPEAALNVVVDPLYGRETALYLRDKFGMPYIDIGNLPIGFRETGKLIVKTCAMLQKDAGLALADGERKRAECYVALKRVNTLTGLPKGTKFAVHGTVSECIGYGKFLTSYLGMEADVISCTEGETELKNEFGDFVSENGMKRAVNRDLDETSAEIVFADGNTIGRLRSRGLLFTGVEISLPSIGYIDVVPKTHIGHEGARLIVEQVLNGLAY